MSTIRTTLAAAAVTTVAVGALSTAAFAGGGHGHDPECPDPSTSSRGGYDPDPCEPTEEPTPTDEPTTEEPTPTDEPTTEPPEPTEPPTSTPPAPTPTEEPPTQQEPPPSVGTPVRTVTMWESCYATGYAEQEYMHGTWTTISSWSEPTGADCAEPLREEGM